MNARTLIGCMLLAFLVISSSFAAQFSAPQWLPVTNAQSGWVEVADADFRFFFKKITTARLAVPLEVKASAVLQSDNEKALYIEYHVAVSGEKLEQLALQNLLENYGADLNGQAQKIRLFLSLFSAVEEGDAYCLLLKDNQISLWLNGRRIGVMAAAGVSDEIFSIWLGDNPISKKQRNRMQTQWQQRLAHTTSEKG